MTTLLIFHFFFSDSIKSGNDRVCKTSIKCLDATAKNGCPVETTCIYEQIKETIIDSENHTILNPELETYLNLENTYPDQCLYAEQIKRNRYFGYKAKFDGEGAWGVVLNTRYCHQCLSDSDCLNTPSGITKFCNTVTHECVQTECTRDVHCVNNVKKWCNPKTYRCDDHSVF